MVISFIGMQSQEVKIKPNVNVVLKSDAEQLEEVVVTAMGIKRDRKALGYAAQDLMNNSAKVVPHHLQMQYKVN